MNKLTFRLFGHPLKGALLSCEIPLVPSSPERAQLVGQGRELRLRQCYFLLKETWSEMSNCPGLDGGVMRWEGVVVSFGGFL